MTANQSRSPIKFVCCSLAIIICLILAESPLYADDQCQFYKSKIDSLNIRNSPTTNSKKVGQYKLLDVFCVQQQKSDWGKTKKGWVYLKLAALLDTKRCNQYNIVTKSLNIREQPTAQSKKIGKYLPKNRFCIFGQNQGWGSTQKGWVSMKYISPVKSSQKKIKPTKTKPLKSSEKKRQLLKLEQTDPVNLKQKKSQVVQSKSELNEKELYKISFGIALWARPEDIDSYSKGTPYTIFVDYNLRPSWLMVRVGYFTYQIKHSESAGTIDIHNTAIYGSGLAVFNIGYPEIKIKISAGIAYVQTDFDVSTSNDSYSESDQGLGPMYSAGGEYKYESVFIGAQFVYLNWKADFEGSDLYSGTNQIQIYISYPF